MDMKTLSLREALDAAYAVSDILYANLNVQRIEVCNDGTCLRCRYLRAVADAEVALGLRARGDASLGTGTVRVLVATTEQGGSSGE